MVKMEIPEYGEGDLLYGIQEARVYVVLGVVWDHDLDDIALTLKLTEHTHLRISSCPLNYHYRELNEVERLLYA